jgi:hypothetical protein
MYLYFSYALWKMHTLLILCQGTNVHICIYIYYPSKHNVCINYFVFCITVQSTLMCSALQYNQLHVWSLIGHLQVVGNLSIDIYKEWGDSIYKYIYVHSYPDILFTQHNRDDEPQDTLLSLLMTLTHENILFSIQFWQNKLNITDHNRN